MDKSPKLHQVAVCSLLLLFVLAAGRPINDPDVWWHLRAGQHIWENAAIPRTDPFSFTSQGHPWVAHEWLAELVYYLLYRAGNFYGLVIGNTVLLGGIFLLLFKLIRLRTAQPLLSAVLTMITAALSPVFWVYRPHLPGYLCLLGFLYLLELYKAGHRKGLWLLPPIMIFWVNIHGSYIIGLILIGLYLLAGLVKKGGDTVRPEPWSPQQLRELLVCLAVTLLAVLLNPNTYKIFFYPFATVRSPSIVNRINEWASPDFHEPFLLVILCLILAGLALVAGSEGRHRVSDLLLVGCFTGLAFFAVRNIALYLLVCVPVFGLYLARVVKPGPEDRQHYALNRAMAAAVVVAALVLWPSPNILSAHQDKSVFPAGAVKYLTDHEIKGNIFNDYNWGGYLLWYRFPQNRVFVDGRTDLYADRVYPDYLKIMNLAPGALELLDSYNPDLLLIKPAAALNEILSRRQDWQVIHRDSVSVLYHKTRQNEGIQGELNKRGIK